MRLGLVTDFAMPLPEAGSAFEADTAPILLTQGDGVLATGGWNVGRTARSRILRGEPTMSGLGLFDWVADLLGKSQAWYNRLNRAQNGLVIVQAQLEACDPVLWRTVWEKKGQPQYADRDRIKDEVIENFQYITVTKDRTPSDSAISTAEAKVEDVQWMVNEYKRLVPEAQAEIDAQRARASAAMAQTELKSPAEVGVEEFERQVKERAKAMGAGALGIVTPILIGVAVLAGLFIFSRR